MRDFQLALLEVDERGADKGGIARGEAGVERDDGALPERAGLFVGKIFHRLQLLRQEVKGGEGEIDGASLRTDEKGRSDGAVLQHAGAFIYECSHAQRQENHEGYGKREQQ